MVKKTGDIDDIFSNAKKRANSITVKKAEKKKAAPKDGGSADNILGKTHSLVSKRKKTEEGYLIYTEEELKIGRGGQTGQCPFDCDCCF